jgi:chromosome partitioning protein
MRCIAVMNQKGGVGKTTTTANLGAALALQGRRVVVVDMDAQANLSLSLNVEAAASSPSSYTVLVGGTSFADALRPTAIPGLRLVASHLDLSGAELELASTIGREYVMRDALRQWIDSSGGAPADYVLFDCPPSLGLLSINALAASQEVLITLQTEFLALQGMTKLIDVVQLLRRRLNPDLSITGILPCLYDSRLKLAREVLGEIRSYFPGQVLPKPVRTSVKLAEAPSYGRTIFEYAPDSNGANDYLEVAREIIRQETRDPALAGLPPFDESRRSLPVAEPAASESSAPRASVAAPVAPAANRKDVSRAESAARARAAKRARAAQHEPAAGSVDASRADSAKRVDSMKGIDSVKRVDSAKHVDVTKRAEITPQATPPIAADDVPPKRAAPRARRANADESVKVNEAPIAPANPPIASQPPASKRARLPIREIPAAPKPTAIPVRTATNPSTKARKPASNEARKLESSQPSIAAATPVKPSSESRDLPASRPIPKPLKPPSPIRSSSTRSAGADAGAPRQAASADDFPPLPPDAFEILSSFGRES